MKSNKQLTYLARSIRGAVFALMVAFGPIAHSQTVWSGPTIDFTQDSSDSDVIIAGSVALSRGQAQWLFNTAAGETFADTPSPVDTEWAFGDIGDYSTLAYAPFSSYRNGDLGSVLIGNPMVLHLINENIYIAVTFSAWGEHGDGGFEYTRSTSGSMAPPPTPTVSLTNPAGGSVLAAPANLALQASASVSSGTVTNVSFFTNGIFVGSVTGSPFNLTLSNMPAASYALTAVATAGGVSATSTVVNISVVSALAVSNSAPAVAHNQFTFSYSANPGLTYVIQQSSNLVNWVSLATNVAPSSVASFTNNFSPAASLYYRVGRAPNP